MLESINNWLAGKPTLGKRSPKWKTVRQEFLLKNNKCAVCSRKTKLEVHHIKPFHLAPELELEESNLITLCEGPTACHFVFGHLGNWKLINEHIISDVLTMSNRFECARKTNDDERASRTDYSI